MNRNVRGLLLGAALLVTLAGLLALTRQPDVHSPRPSMDRSQHVVVSPKEVPGMPLLVPEPVEGAKLWERNELYKDLRYKPPLLPLIDGLDPWVQLKDRHKGERCLLIGNGPSLAQMKDFSFVTKFNAVMGVNKITLGFDRFSFAPNYFATHNAKVISQMHAEISSGGLPAQVVKFIRGERWNGTDEFNHENNILRTQSVSVCSGSDVCKYATVRKDEKTGVEKVEFVSDLSLCQRYCSDCFCDARGAIVEGNTITYISLQILMYMGCGTVYLIGVDHHFKQEGKPNSAQFLKGNDPNHFDPRYFSNMKWDLADLQSSEKHYEIAMRYARQHGLEIRDATLDGKLTIFPKATQDELFGLPVQHLSAFNIPNIACHHRRPSVGGMRSSGLDGTHCMHARASASTTPRLTVVMILRTDEQGHSFNVRPWLNNVISQFNFVGMQVIVVLPQMDGVGFDEEYAIYNAMRSHANVEMLKMQAPAKHSDLLNFAILSSARGEYVTEWDVLERRPAHSLHAHMQVLLHHTDIDFVSSFVRVSRSDGQRWDDVSATSAEVVRFFTASEAVDPDVGSLFKRDVQSDKLIATRVHLSSPMWRRNFFERFGLWDDRFAPLSGWELWLRAKLQGARYYHIPEALKLIHLPEEGDQQRAVAAAFALAVREHANLLPDHVLADGK